MSPRPGRFPLALDRLGASPNEAAPTTPRVSPAQGLGLDSQAVRERMVSRLRQQGIACEPVLVAMARVPRHAFVDGALAAQAYENTALPIGHGQTISQPWVVARMIELLFAVRPAAATSLGRVLEIGTGCGYQAAVLSCVAASVVSIERMRALFDRARENLAALRADNLRLVYGDGRLGHAPNAPYDSILCAAGGDDIPPAWLDQLAVGGRLVAPTRAADGRGQVLVSIDRAVNGWSRQVHEEVRFVPLRSGVA